MRLGKLRPSDTALHNDAWVPRPENAGEPLSRTPAYGRLTVQFAHCRSAVAASMSCRISSIARLRKASASATAPLASKPSWTHKAAKARITQGSETGFFFYNPYGYLRVEEAG